MKNPDKKILLSLMIYLAGNLIFLPHDLAFSFEGTIELEEILRIDAASAGQQFHSLSSLAYNRLSDEILVTDTDAGRIYSFNRRGEISLILGRGEELRFPAGIAADGRGTIYVGEKESGVIKVLEGERGSLTGPQRVIMLPVLEGEKKISSGRMAVDPSGNLHITDTLNGWILVYGHDGEFRYRVGREGKGSKSFSLLRDVACDTRNRVYSASRGMNPISIFDNAGQYLRPLRDPRFDVEEVMDPIAIAVDGKNRLWVLDGSGNKLRIYDPSGHHVQTIEGENLPGRLFLPVDIEFDVFDNLYILERGVNRVRVFSVR